MKSIKTYEEALKATGRATIKERVKSFLIKILLPKRYSSLRKLEIITEAINDGWKADWTDGDQRKWYPWFIVDKNSPSGFRFDVSFYDYSGALAGNGSRLCFKTEEASIYAGKKFIDLYIDTIA